MGQFRANHHNPRGQWAILNQLSGRTRVKSFPKATLSDLADTFANFVCDPTRPTDLPIPIPFPNVPLLQEFSPVTEADVSRLLEKIKPYKATGSDAVPPCFLKMCLKDVRRPLTAIINQSLQTGIFPSSCKQAHVCPLHKSGDALNSLNYRPISLLPAASKLLEKVVQHQLVSFFSKNPEVAALPIEQFAYRNQHSCEDALTLAIDQWNRALDNGDCCCVVFCDMSKAFDRVRHTLLIEKLAAVGCGGTVLRWLADYLTGRTQQVVINDARSSSKPCSRGVPQGSVLGPLLFSLYVRQVPRVFKYSVPLQYADDISFWITGSNTSAIVTKLQSDLHSLDSHLDDIGLKLNPTKTKFMVIRKPNTYDDFANSVLTCKGEQIEVVQQAKYLGIFIDEHLHFHHQVKYVVDSVLRKAGTFKHGRRNLTTEARRTFYLSVCQATLDFASNAYVHCLSNQLYNRLVITSHLCMKKVFGLDRSTPTQLILSKFNLYSFEQRVNLKLYVLVYRCLTHHVSPLLTSLFLQRALGPNTRAVTRGQSTAALVLPHAFSRYGLHSVSFLAADRWNALPSECRQARSPSVFVILIKHHLGFPVKRHSLLGLP